VPQNPPKNEQYNALFPLQQVLLNSCTLSSVIPLVGGVNDVVMGLSQPQSASLLSYCLALHAVLALNRFQTQQPHQQRQGCLSCTFLNSSQRFLVNGELANALPNSAVKVAFSQIRLKTNVLQLTAALQQIEEEVQLKAESLLGRAVQPDVKFSASLLKIQDNLVLLKDLQKIIKKSDAEEVDLTAEDVAINVVKGTTLNF